MIDKNIVSFLFEGEITVRIVERDGAPWFVTADVCRALGLTNPAEAVLELDEDEKGISSADTLRGIQEAVIVSESGLYALIFKSRQAQAIRFRKWVTAVVLPAIRQYGHYQMPPQVPPSRVVSDIGKIGMVREARQTFGPRAAGELWVSLGLPVVNAMRLSPAQSDLFLSLERPAFQRPFHS